MINISKEHIGYVVAILSVIASGVISWYFYDKSQEYRLPVYYIEPFSSVVFKADENKEFPFKVTSSDGKPILKSIYLTTHYFWNKGKKPILESDILETLKVKFLTEDDNLEIVSVSISKFSRRVVACSSKQVDKNEFELSYKVMENNDGCAIDILFLGEDNHKVEVTGTIIGVDDFEVSSQTREEYFKKLHWYSSYIRYFPGLVVVIPFSIILVLYLKTKNLSKFKFWSDFFVYILFVSQIYFLVEIYSSSPVFYATTESPKVSRWESTTANKLVQPTAKAAAD